MTHLGQLKERLNSDAQLRQRFYADPVGVLQQAGLWLSTKQAMGVRLAVRRAAAGPAGKTPPVDAVVKELGQALRDAGALTPM